MNFIQEEPKKSRTGPFLIGGFALFAFSNVYLSQADSGLLAALGQIGGQFTVENQTSPTTSPLPTPTPWTVLSKLHEKDESLAALALSVAKKNSKWTEERLTKNPDSPLPSIRNVTLSGPDLDIGLKLLNTVTGEVTSIVVNRRSGQLVAPTGYDISIITRPSGIRWNYWNTQFKVNAPANTIVIKNNFPELKLTPIKRQAKNSKGKTYTVIDQVPNIESRFYVPYSPDLHFPELIEAGRRHVSEVVVTARQILDERQVTSRAVPGTKVSALPALSNEMFKRLPLLEQSDLSEFIIDPQKTAERVLVLLGANEFNAFRFTCNSSSACGWIQFTPGTYRMIVKMYPAAKLEPDFSLGAVDQVNVMAAAMLLYDYNLADLVKRYGQPILTDPRLDEYLAAAYNGSPRWVHQSLDQTLGKGRGDAWTVKLREETLGFMIKLRYLRSHGF